MNSLAYAAAALVAAVGLSGSVAGAEPVVTPLPAADLGNVRFDSVALGDGVANPFRGAESDAPAFYFISEATFFSRTYDVVQGQFSLANAAPSLTVPAGTLPNSGSWQDVEETIWNSTYNPYGYSWNIGQPQVVNTLADPFSKASQLTGAPRLTLGRVFGNGWGVQGRYWTMQNGVGANSSIPFPVSPENNFSGALGRTTGVEQFAAQTIDLEATRDFGLAGWWFLGTCGARYAEFTNQRAESAVGRIRTGADVTGNAQIPNIGMYSNAMYAFGNASGSAMYGTGLTFSLQGLRPIGDTGFALYAVARGSTLWGETQSFAQSQVSYDSFYGSGSAISTSFSNLNDQTYYIAETQFGGQWSRHVRWLNGRFFARAGFEYQWWRGIVNQANALAGMGDAATTRGVGTAPSTTVPAGAETVIGAYTFPTNPNYLGGIGTTGGSASQQGGIVDFDLIGFNVGAGFMW